MGERKYIKKLVGEKVYLSPISLEDVEEYTYLVNDLSMSVGLGSPVYCGVVDFENEKKILENLKDQKYQFAVRKIEDNKLLGNIGFNEVNELHKTGVLGIMLANQEEQNKGYGKEAINLLLDFGFSLLNLKNISLSVYEYNKIAYNVYKKIGFKETGKLRKVLEIMGKRYDVIIMDMLQEEYSSKYIKNELEKRHSF